MFAGIIAEKSTVKDLKVLANSMEITLTRPESFADVKTGDSICVDGICLTVTAVDAEAMTFHVGAETLKVTKWQHRLALHELHEGHVHQFNVELSLRMGDRIHGHLVTGHTEALCMLLERNVVGESLILKLSLPPSVRSFVWPKGSIALNGVSLTINATDYTGASFEVCLVPETQERTNLKNLALGEWVHLETDSFAKAVVTAVKATLENKDPRTFAAN